MSAIENNNWLTSKETCKKLKISDCDLMHFRLEGKLNFYKKGNAYLYSKDDIEKLLNKK